MKKIVITALCCYLIFNSFTNASFSKELNDEIYLLTSQNNNPQLKPINKNTLKKYCNKYKNKSLHEAKLNNNNILLLDDDYNDKDKSFSDIIIFKNKNILSTCCPDPDSDIDE